MTPPQPPRSIIPPILKPAVVTALPSVALDPAGRIAVDVSCRKCGYNLRGLQPDGCCPECSGGVAQSLKDDRLSLCNPIWVRGLASGTAFIALGATIFAIDFTSSVLGFDKKFPSALREVFSVAWPVFTIVGYWRVTIPEPWKPVEDSFISDRRLARYTPLLLFATMVTLFFISRWTGQSVEVFFPIVALEAFVLIVSGMNHLRCLALRIPDLAMARWLGIIKWVTVGLVGLALLAYVGQFVSPATKSAPTRAPSAQGIGCAITLGLPTVMFWFVSVFVRLWMAMKDVARLAAAQWNAKSISADRNPQSTFCNP